jgi:hypothetical protein
VISIALVALASIEGQIGPMVSVYLFFWWLVDVIRIIAGKYKDGSGRPL